MITLDNKQFITIKEKLYKYCGIYLDESKLQMVQNRICYLMDEMHIQDMDKLLYSIDNNTKTKQHFINAFTTNKTNFFREIFHFEDMINRSLPALFKLDKPIKIYCAASSTGQEPYSIAMSVLYMKKLCNSHIPVSIIATDIDTDALTEAKGGVYKIDFRYEKFPHWCNIDEYFEEIGGNQTHSSIHQLKIKDEVKSMVTFKQLNLFDKHYPFRREEFDIIFCRNVLIYFKPEDQQQILSKLIDTLKINGTFYLGHSEILYDMAAKFDKLGNKTYIKLKV